MGDEICRAAGAAVSKTGADLLGNLRFESISLQRGVCEPAVPREIAAVWTRQHRVEFLALRLAAAMRSSWILSAGCRQVDGRLGNCALCRNRGIRGARAWSRFNEAAGGRVPMESE